jgi:hypothetical protein
LRRAIKEANSEPDALGMPIFCRDDRDALGGRFKVGYQTHQAVDWGMIDGINFGCFAAETQSSRGNCLSVQTIGFGITSLPWRSGWMLI